MQFFTKSALFLNSVVWKDEIDRALPATPHSSQMQPPASSQPMPSQRQRAIMARGLSAPTPQKRHRSPSESGRRKENIELALSQGGESAQKPQTSASYTDELPQFDTGDDSGDEYFTTTSSPPRRTLSFQLDTQEPPCKKLRTDNDGFESGSGGYMFMTPPMSDGNILRIGITSSQPESPTRGRGKGKDMSQWEKIHADENHPCHQHTASLRSESSQTAASNPASVSNMTPDSIKTLLSGMSTVLPAYIAKLERKQVAMEKSDSFKVQKIRCLEEEISSCALACLLIISFIVNLGHFSLL